MNQRGDCIILIGFMGVGKTAVGNALAARTGLPLQDTDAIVSASVGLPIPKIFAELGESVFRDKETEVLTKLPIAPAVIATGGGIILRPDNVQLLRKLGRIVWLDAEKQTLFSRISQAAARPLLQSEDPRATFTQLLQEREPFYRDAADFRIDTSHLTPDEVADTLLERIKRL